MNRVLTANEMRELEAAAMDAGRVTGAQLMERAGQGAADAIRARAGSVRDAVILCGPGNNGGDGFVIARHLSEAGWRVHVLLMGDPAKLPHDAALNHARWCEIGPVAPYTGAALSALDLPEGADVVLIDALFGIGQRAPLDAVLAPALDWVAMQKPAFVAAVDLPTGFDADTGAPLAATPMPCDLAITFHAAKLIHGMDVMGGAEIVVVDIGLDP